MLKKRDNDVLMKALLLLLQPRLVIEMALSMDMGMNMNMTIKPMSTH